MSIYIYLRKATFILSQMKPHKLIFKMINFFVKLIVI